MATRSARAVHKVFSVSRRQNTIYRTMASTWLIRLALVSNPSRQVLRELTTDDVGRFLGVQHIFEDLDGEPLGEFSAREMKKALKDRLDQLEAKKPDLSETRLGINVSWLAAKLKLGTVEQKILTFVVLHNILGLFRQSLNAIEFDFSPEDTHEVLGCMLSVPSSKTWLAISAKSTLIQSGIVRFGSCEFADLTDMLETPSHICRLLVAKHTHVDALLEGFFSEAAPAKLQSEDYSHLAKELDLMCAYFLKAQGKRIAGVNILIYGDPGVGKSEFARLIAKRNGQRLYEVACADRQGTAISGQARFSSFMLSQKMLASATDCLVLFDEIEDVFPSTTSGFLAWMDDDAKAPANSPGKAWVNRVLETNPVPAIWITNSVEQIDPAYLRRFDYTIEFPKPPKDVRHRIAKTHLATTKASSRFIDRIAAWEKLTPSQIEKAAKIARLVATSPLEAEALAERALQHSARLLGQQVPSCSTGRSPDYDLAYLNTNVSTAPLITGLKARPRGTFCFYGASGTGKTALARHMAEQIGKPVLVKRASDLLRKYVGETEQNIAQMFREAQGQDAVLVLDEADSLLADRRTASQSWEISQVNELLTHMEDFPGIFICTTNLLDHLDPASLRRFAFKIRFDCLKRDQRRQLFSAELERLSPGSGVTAATVTARLDRLDRLTPGDFAAVARQWALWATQPDAQALITALEEECSVKGGGGRAIGFTT